MTMGFPAAENGNIAIIGATGAGKTTLAVGLYATSTGDFTVSPVGDVTSRYLEIRKTSIEEGFWPAAGLEADNVELRLNLHASGNQMDIVFREYMGERICEIGTQRYRILRTYITETDGIELTLQREAGNALPLPTPEQTPAPSAGGES